jgi:hypothetical protein
MPPHCRNSELVLSCALTRYANDDNSDTNLICSKIRSLEGSVSKADADFLPEHADDNFESDNPVESSPPGVVDRVANRLSTLTNEEIMI